LDVGEDDAMIKRTLKLTEVVLDVEEPKGNVHFIDAFHLFKEFSYLSEKRL